MMTVRPDTQAVPIATYHTHPSIDGDNVYGCFPKSNGKKLAQTLGDNLPIPTAAPNDSLAGGGSNSDWGFTEAGYPAYTITVNNYVYRLDPNFPDHAKNTNKWVRQNLQACPGKV